MEEIIIVVAVVEDMVTLVEEGTVMTETISETIVEGTIVTRLHATTDQMRREVVGGQPFRTATRCWQSLVDPW